MNIGRYYQWYITIVVCSAIVYKLPCFNFASPHPLSCCEPSVIFSYSAPLEGNHTTRDGALVGAFLSIITIAFRISPIFWLRWWMLQDLYGVIREDVRSTAPDCSSCNSVSTCSAGNKLVRRSSLGDREDRGGGEGTNCIA